LTDINWQLSENVFLVIVGDRSNYWQQWTNRCICYRLDSYGHNSRYQCPAWT